MTTLEHAPLPDGMALPPSGRWWFDPDHTRVEFIARYLKVTNVRGRFRRVTGSLTLGRTLADAQLDVTIAMASLDSASHPRDERLRGPESLDVAQHPLARFRSDRVEQRGHATTVSGRLQLAGVTRPVELEIAYLATNTDPWGRTTAQFFGAGALNRSDWGITGNVAVPGGGYAIGESIRLEVEVQLVAEPPSTLPPLPSVRAVEPESWPYPAGRA